MPRPKPEVSGKRVGIYLPPQSLQIADQIENLSGFVQICLEQAPDIMAWAILNRADPKKYHARKKMDEVVEEYNEKFPLDPLTQKRQGKWQDPSQKLPDVLL
jgi:hypothetical protein